MLGLLSRTRERAALLLEPVDRLLDVFLAPLVVGFLDGLAPSSAELLLIGQASAAGDRLIQTSGFAGHRHSHEPDHRTQHSAALREPLLLGEEQITLSYLLDVACQRELFAQAPELN